MKFTGQNNKKPA